MTQNKKGSNYKKQDRVAFTPRPLAHKILNEVRESGDYGAVSEFISQAVIEKGSK